MWYQGIKNAPPIVQSCMQSILLNRATHPVILLDKSNIDKYVQLPDYINQKFKSGVITITHFSDIVRMYLLKRYGGYWIDSTYLITTPLTYDNYTYFTLKLRHCYKGALTKCIWAGNFMTMPKESYLSTYAYNAFLHYWKNYNKLIDYFLIDYIIKIAYDNIKEFNDLFPKIPYIECSVFRFTDILNNIYDGKGSPIVCTFNKIFRRGSYSAYRSNKKTNLGYILDNFKINIENYSNYDEIIK